MTILLANINNIKYTIPLMNNYSDAFILYPISSNLNTQKFHSKYKIMYAN